MHVLVLRLPEHGFPFPCGVCACRAAGTTLSAAFLLAEQHKLNPLRDKAVAHIDGRSFHNLNVDMQVFRNRVETSPRLCRAVPIADVAAQVGQDLFLRDVVRAVAVDVDRVFLRAVQSETPLAAVKTHVVLLRVQLNAGEAVGRQYGEFLGEVAVDGGVVEQFLCQLVVGFYHREPGGRI